MMEAINEAKQGLNEGGRPIGSVLVLDNKIVGKGRNLGVQKGSVILHAEMDAIENAGKLTPEEYARSIMYTTLSPCQMCSGTIVYLGIKNVISAENVTVMGAEDFLREKGVNITTLDLDECKELMKKAP
jgi:cytosine deaminase